MTTVSENLQTIKTSTEAIKQALIDKGGNITGDITTWANVIGEINTGGPGLVIKIKNKLNGKSFGGPSYKESYHAIHTYEIEGNVSNKYLIPKSFKSGLYSSDDYHVEITSSQMPPGGIYGLRLDSTNLLDFFAGGGSVNTEGPEQIYIVFCDDSGNYDVDNIYVEGMTLCFLKNTKITLLDNTQKYVQDITYNDELLVWNFDKCKYDKAKPLWIKKEEITNYYYKVTLDNGIILNLVGSNGKCHRLFSVEDSMFISATDMVGKTTYTESGESKVISCERIEEICDYYNIITNYHINLFANGVLTSCRYNNIYPIENMKFVKDNRLEKAPKWKLYELFKDHRVLDKYIEGLRLYEQINIPLEDTINYCQNLENLRKNLDDFEDNVSLINNIEESEVGWIDRNGKVYGFKLYMPGLLNHIILAEKICKELNIETNNPSRYLEKQGWVKYTTDFILSSNDEIINNNLLNTIKKFINSNKLKTPGKIRIGYSNSPQIDISEFEKMDIYSFEYRKHINLK